MEVDDLPDHWVSLGGVFTKVAPTAVVTGIPVIHTAVLLEGDVKSIHAEDDSTSYQNTTGNPAYCSFFIVPTGSTGSTRHVKIWSSPNDDSTTGATLLFELGTADINAFDNVSDSLTVSNMRIENNHYLVIENVDDLRAGTNSIRINNADHFTVLEYTNI